MQTLEGKVKSVNSGTTLTLVSTKNKAEEKNVQLAFVTGPWLKREGDEPYAFESRDFLRRLIVGKVVRFQILYTVTSPAGKTTEYGRALLSPTGPHLPELLLENGWVKLRDNAGHNEQTEEAKVQLEKLRVLEAKAKSNGAGLWKSSSDYARTQYDLQNPQAFLEQWKSQVVDAIVEKVLAGDRLIVRLALQPGKHQQCLIIIAGIRAPMTRRTNTAEGKEKPGEDGGDEARTYVEERLLQRNVTVKLVGTTPQHQLIAVVRHPNGNIAEFILKDGFARCFDHHSTMLGSDMASLRQAETYAKEHRLGLFKSHVGRAAGSSDGVDATVSRVQSADTLYVRIKSGGEKKVTLSSIRQPKPTDAAQAPYGAEAKEFLRKRLIGKHVVVCVDARRPPQEGYEAREMATVKQSSKNVALLMVENGWASVIRHRRDDDDRSPIYDDLLAAEEAAQKEKKGMWSGKPTASKSYTDASESVRTAKVHLSVLQRQRRIPAVVDYVKSGSRFTVLIPKENVKLTLVLSGVRAPRSARKADEKGEPFGQEAHDFAVRRCNQRDVEVDFEALDKVGGFIGTVYVNRENFAKLLVEEGLATVHAYSAEQAGSATELLAAEAKAKEARKGLWHDWDPTKQENQEEASQARDGAKSSEPAKGTDGESRTNGETRDYRDVTVTYFDDSCHLKLQQSGSATEVLERMMKALQLGASASTSSLPGPPKAGEYVTAKFSEDGQWYRARVRHVDREAEQAEVSYIDYGNSERVPFTHLRPIPQPDAYSPQKLKPQAIDAVFSFLQFPKQAEYVDEAASYVGQVTAAKQLVAKVDHVSAPDGSSSSSAAATGTSLHVTLFDPSVSGSVKDSVNAELVREGLAMVNRKAPAWEKSQVDTLKELQGKEDEARSLRKGMWEYGDLTED